MAERSEPVVLYRPWVPLFEQLLNPDLRDHLARPPRPDFYEAQGLLKLNQRVFLPLESAKTFLREADGADPLISSADKDLYCLLRSDLMLVDLSVPSFGEQGVDVLFASLGGLPVIGLTDRFQNAPSILSRLDCLIAPSSVDQILHALDAFGSNKAPQSLRIAPEVPVDEPPSSIPSAEPSITGSFASDVLRAAGAVTKKDTTDGDDQGPPIP